MIISDSHKFVFFHVPKTGGTTLCSKLAPYSRSLDLYESLRVNYQEVLSNALLNIKDENLILKAAESIPDEHLLPHYRKDRSKIGWMNLFHDRCAIHINTSRRKIFNKFKNEYKDYFKFCFCRNPWDYVFSVFKNKIVIDQVASIYKDGMDWDEEVDKRMTKDNFLNFLKNEKENEVIHNNFLREKVCQLNHVSSPDGTVLTDRIFKLEESEESIKIIQDIIGISLENSTKLNVSISKASKNKNKNDNYIAFYDDWAKDFVKSNFSKDIIGLKYEF